MKQTNVQWGGHFKKKILPVILLVVLISVVGGLSYAIWNNSYSTNVNTITSGVVSMSYTESSNVITISDALPMTDDNGKTQTNYFDFSVTSNMTLNNGDPDNNISYNIEIESLEVDSGYTALINSQIKVYLENKDTNSILVNPTLISNLSDNGTNKILYATNHVHKYGTNSITTNYRLRAWIDMNVSANDFSTTNYEFKFRVNINGNADALSRPVVENLLVTNTTVTADVKSERDITYYGFSESASTEPTEWKEVGAEGSSLTQVSSNNIEYNVSKLDSTNKEVTFLSNTKNYSLDYTFNEGGNYYLWLKDDLDSVTLNNQVIPVVTASLTTLNNLGYQKSSVKDYADSFWTKMVVDTDADTTNDSGIYRYTDKDGTTYIYRGHINNNWVKFGKFTEDIPATCSGRDNDNNVIISAATCDNIQKKCQCSNAINAGDDMYWRIVRVTGSGEIRMIYAGNVAPTEETKYTNDNVIIGSEAFNTNYNRAEYVGYQYTIGDAHGTGTDSTIKTIIDNWYDSNLKTNYEDYISTSNYCYDRTTYSGTVRGYSRTGNGIGTTATNYIEASRFVSSTSNAPGGTGPSLICSNQNDNYNLNIGLLSLDEVSLAGLKYTESGKNDKSNYLVSNSWYWTGSPQSYDYSGFMFYVTSTGAFNQNVNTTFVYYKGNSFYYSPGGVRPVISLKSDVTVKEGTDGTWEHPYEFSLN